MSMSIIGFFHGVLPVVSIILMLLVLKFSFFFYGVLPTISMILMLLLLSFFFFIIVYSL
jgi:hypothetical protein